MLVHALVMVLSLQGFAGKRGVVLTFEAFQPSGIREVGLVFLPAHTKTSGDPLARDVCQISGKSPTVCARAHTVRVKRFPLPPAQVRDTVFWVLRDGWKAGGGEVGLWVRGVDGAVEVGWLKEGAGLQVVGDTFRWPFAGYDPGQSYTYPWGIFPDVEVLWFKFWTWGDMFVTEVKSAVSEGRLYMADGGNVLEVMDVETGAVVDSVVMVSNVNAAVLIGDSLLVVASTFGTLQPEKDTTLKMFRLPDLEPVWGMTGLEAVQSVMVVGDTIVTGGWKRVCAITRDGRIIQEWPLQGLIQVPVLVGRGVLAGWGEGGNLVFYRWPTLDTLWRVNLNIGGGWLRVLPSYPDILWVMEYDEPLYGLVPATHQVIEIPTTPEATVTTVAWRDTLFVLERFWEWNSHILGSTLKVWIPEREGWRLRGRVYMHLGAGGGGRPVLSGRDDTTGAVWISAQYGYVVDPRTFRVDSLGEMPGNWEEWQYAVPSSFFYPLFYRDLVVHANRMGRYVLRGRRVPPPGWGEGAPSLRLVFRPRRVRVEGVPGVWKGKGFWLEDMLGRVVVSGKVRGGEIDVGPLKAGVYHLHIGNTWTRKVVVF